MPSNQPEKCQHSFQRVIFARKCRVWFVPFFSSFIHIKHFMGEGKRSRQFKTIFSSFSADLTILRAFMAHFGCYPCIICVIIAASSQVTRTHTHYILYFEIRTHNFLHIFIPHYLCLYSRVHMHLCMNNTRSFQILISNSKHSKAAGACAVQMENENHSQYIRHEIKNVIQRIIFGRPLYVHSVLKKNSFVRNWSLLSVRFVRPSFFSEKINSKLVLNVIFLISHKRIY